MKDSPEGEKPGEVAHLGNSKHTSLIHFPLQVELSGWKLPLPQAFHLLLVILKFQTLVFQTLVLV